ncbi:MAG: DEAD/DEAH box helicase family protein, partial [Clostridia bacterium]|nr:DEAD/DEAH box helicase family protein [Clostridia bacterium]
IEREDRKRFTDELNGKEISEWFERLVAAYRKWAVWERKWTKLRNETIRSLPFPYPYRDGQKEFAAGVYRTIIREKKLFAMAPTGVGKTLSTVFPAVKAMGEGQAEKLFYLTAKTMLRTVAEETFALLIKNGLKLKSVTITAKEKVCALEKPECNPFACPRAKGHFDRVNDALYEMLTNEETSTRERIMEYAEKYNVCPFEFCLDLTLWADAVICDYNYVFDPNVALKRFFAADQKRDFVFLIDEAHNLPERAREMYSATVVKEDFLRAKKLLGTRQPKLCKRLDACNKAMLELKRRCDGFAVEPEFLVLNLSLNRFLTEAEEYLKDEKYIIIDAEENA